MLQVGQKVINTNPRSVYFDKTGIVERIEDGNVFIRVEVNSAFEDAGLTLDQGHWVAYPNQRRSLCSI